MPTTDYDRTEWPGFVVTCDKQETLHDLNSCAQCCLNPRPHLCEDCGERPASIDAEINGESSRLCWPCAEWWLNHAIGSDT